MSDQFLGEIRIFPFSFPPTGWAFCEGQIMPISQNTALFALLGVTYGGDGMSTFGLPDLRGRAPLQHGQGPGLSEYPLGDRGGSSNVTLLQHEIPLHTHNIHAAAQSANSRSPEGKVLARSVGGLAWAQPAGAGVPMAYQAMTVAGVNEPHNNMQPYLTVNFCIALQGIFPQRP